MYIRINKNFCFSLIYFLFVIMGIVILDYQIGITLEIAIFIVIVSAALHMMSELLVAVGKRRSRNVTEVTSKHIYRQKNKKKSIVVVALVLLMILSGGGYFLYENSMAEIPGSLVEFGRKYPEAKQFVSDYHKYKNTSWN